MTLRLELTGISKQYPGVKANDGIGLKVQPGEIHAVLGENGAGKSTLMKIIYGAVQPDAGSIRWNGELVRVKSPAQARRLGISMVYQHFSLFETLTAAENVWLGLDKSISLAEVTARIREVSESYGLVVDPLRPVLSLSVGERQRVEIVRALMSQTPGRPKAGSRPLGGQESQGDDVGAVYSGPQLLILDEPTSVLTPQAATQLFVTLRQLADSGCAILYISHKLDEIRALCHHCTVLRGGRVTGEVDPRTQSNAQLSTLMIGAEPPMLHHPARKAGPVALGVRRLSIGKTSPFGTTLVDVDLNVRAGEVVGVAGVSGNGQQELMAALSGEDRRGQPGSVLLFGDDIARASARKRRRLGLNFVPEERLGRGAVPTLSLAQNTLLTRTENVTSLGWLRTAQVQRLTEHLISRFKVKASGPGAAARSLSGGNLQKFLVGREIDANPKVLVIAQPTWGVDVGAAAQIRGELLALRDAGCAVLVVSEELDELFEISDRLVVMAQGRLSPPIAVADATRALIGEWMSGLWKPEPHHAQA